MVTMIAAGMLFGLAAALVTIAICAPGLEEPLDPERGMYPDGPITMGSINRDLRT